MADITYESLVAARKAKTEKTGEMDIMKMANVALSILEQVTKIKGQGGGVLQSRPTGETTTDMKQTKSPVDVESILQALHTVKSLKGDIKITELESLLKEHKDQVTALLGKL